MPAKKTEQAKKPQEGTGENPPTEDSLPPWHKLLQALVWHSLLILQSSSAPAKKELNRTFKVELGSVKLNFSAASGALHPAHREC